jgi:hypothetical protein
MRIVLAYDDCGSWWAADLNHLSDAYGVGETAEAAVCDLMRRLEALP